MKRLFGLLCLVLAIACPLQATTLTGTIKLPSGANLTGKLRLTLSHPSRSITASAVVVPYPINLTVTNGALTGSPTVYGNDDLQPSNTYYWAQYFNSNGIKVMEHAFYITGASFDIGAAQPTTITTTNISYANVTTSLSATATLDFPSTLTLSSADLTITVTGAAVGDPVALGTPAAPDANTCFTAFVSATNTVTVRFNNYSSGTVNPASGSYKVTVFK